MNFQVPSYDIQNFAMLQVVIDGHLKQQRLKISRHVAERSDLFSHAISDQSLL